MKFDYQLYPYKKDGKIYLKVSNKDTKYDYDIGNAHFVTENITVANKDISKYKIVYFPKLALLLF